MTKGLMCHIGLHKWSPHFRVFVGVFPDGVGYGAANGTSIFLAPCLRCETWKRETFHEPIEHWIDAVPQGSAYQGAIMRMDKNQTVEEAKDFYRRAVAGGLQA